MLAADCHVSATCPTKDSRLNKRIFNKRMKQLRGAVAEGVRLYTTRPRGGHRSQQWTELGVGMLHVDIGIYFALRHQWRPGPLAGTWISDTSKPDIEEPAADRLEATGTLTYSNPRDDRVIAHARYRVSAVRTGERWEVRILTVQDGAAAALY